MKPKSAAQGVRAPIASSDRPTRSRRHNLSQDEQRTIAQMYAQSGASTAEICERFKIGESSLYRVLQRRGAVRRGRIGASQGTPVVVAAASSGTTAAARQEFRISFRAQSVFQAADVRGAMSQAESLGAIEITAVTREN